MTPRYDEAIRRIDEANAADPNTLDVGGGPRIPRKPPTPR